MTTVTQSTHQNTQAGTITEKAQQCAAEAAEANRQQWDAEAADIHELAMNTVTPDWNADEPTLPPFTGEALERFRAAITTPPKTGASIADRVLETFGPNPCRRQELVSPEGETVGFECDRKRCSDCGPRKQLQIQLQLTESLGTIAWVGRVAPATVGTDGHTVDSAEHATLVRSLAATKKQHQRNGTEFTYQITGDKVQGWIVVSDVQLAATQARMVLKDWFKRIADSYRVSAQRIRRSVSLGRVSLMSRLYRMKEGNSGHPSGWRFLRPSNRHDTALQATMADREHDPHRSAILARDPKWLQEWIGDRTAPWQATV